MRRCWLPEDMFTLIVSVKKARLQGSVGGSAFRFLRFRFHFSFFQLFPVRFSYPYMGASLLRSNGKFISIVVYMLYVLLLQHCACDIVIE